MKSLGWSSLFLGTILATSGLGTTWADDPATPPTIQSTASGGDFLANSLDLTVDPAAIVAAAIDRARAGDAVAEEELDRIITGSIMALTPGPKTGGLTELPAPKGSVLSAPKTAPEPLRPQPASLTPSPAGEATTKHEPTAENAPAPTAPAVDPVATPEAVVDPAKAAAPTETPPGEVVAPQAAEVPAPADKAVEAPAEAPKAAEAIEARPAEVLPVEAAEATSRPQKVEAAETVAPEKVEAAAASPAPEPAKAETNVASVMPSETTAPATAGGGNYSTASEPVAPVAAKAMPPVEPTVTATTTVAPAPVVATVSGVVTGAPATPVPAATAAATPSTEAAIAATLASEAAAAALKTALADLQPLAGTAEDRADRAALLAFYSDRAFVPLFVDGQGATERARGAAQAVARAAEDGLEPRDYALPRVEAGLDPQVRSKAEIAFAQTAVRFARHLQSGRFDPGRVHELVTPTPPKTEAREVLDRLAGSASTAEVLASYAPTHQGYRRLKAMLADFRAATPDVPMVMVPVGPTLKPGQRDARVALLRERLGVGGVASDAEVFDPSLAEAVKSFQRDRGLTPSGTVGRETVSALNGEKNGTAARIADMISNMERWRWLPRDLGDLHVFVNVPDFHLDVMKSGQSVHHARVIVGKPSNPTPIFSDTMEQVVVNPYWNVPYSIVKKEMLGRLQSSAGQSLSRGGYEIRVGREMVDPTTVDWTTVNAANVSIRQRPGGGNALGNIKFLFPNQHAVYLHDTSSRGLFAQSFRALSHGCVRVHEPFSFADAVLSEEPEKIDGERLKKMVGGSERTIGLKRTVPVHINYFTAWVDDGGQLQTRPDVYGHDAKVKRLLGM